MLARAVHRSSALRAGRWGVCRLMSSDSSALFAKFEDVAKRAGPAILSLSNDEKLRFYGLFKQATEGDAAGERPGLFDLKVRARAPRWPGAWARRPTSRVPGVP